ncbi:Coatomer subunit zeta-1 [Perkinsus chesapeaki]|uniref:Coatomer subunit zeta-1 n=1 Tax=Perkinsus chesapeaki TaxID=330153 RepID=A0A7J6N244_PERCH|nr:Coatomer subunit zeta-1 [Perkinsus chesapeaki]
MFKTTTAAPSSSSLFGALPKASESSAPPESKSAAEWRSLLESVTASPSKPLVGGDSSDVTERVAEAHAKIRQMLRVAGLLRELQASFADRQKSLVTRLSMLEEEAGESVVFNMRLAKRKQAVLARQAALEKKMAEVLDLLRRRRQDYQIKELQRKDLWDVNCRLIDLTRGQLSQQLKPTSSGTEQTAELDMARSSSLVNEKEIVALRSKVEELRKSVEACARSINNNQPHLHLIFLCVVVMASIRCVAGILILDDEGKRLAAKYYDDNKFADLAAEKKFEKELMAKTARLNNRNDVEVALVDEYVVLVRQSNDVMLAVLARESENDIMMLDFTTTLYQVLCNITHNNVCRKKIIDKLDLVFLMIDEAVEKGVILEMDSAVITSRIKMQNDESSTTASDDHASGSSRAVQGYSGSSQEASFKSALSSVRDQIGNFLSR